MCFRPVLFRRFLRLSSVWSSFVFFLQVPFPSLLSSPLVPFFSFLFALSSSFATGRRVQVDDEAARFEAAYEGAEAEAPREVKVKSRGVPKELSAKDQNTGGRGWSYLFSP